LREALTHRFRHEHYGLLIAQMLAHVDFLESAIAETYQRVEVLLRPVSVCSSRPDPRPARHSRSDRRDSP